MLHILSHMWRLKFVNVSEEYWLLETWKGHMEGG